ncbi:MAG: 2-amino-4-hydroxy-6-hydroxymethyldihydropteridine diphosphokinase [Halioglobus sp.]
MSRAYIALGSNLNHPAEQLRLAVTTIDTWDEATVDCASHMYRSKAVGPGEQPDYLNAVVSITTSLIPTALLEKLQTLENNQGRVRQERWGARTLDLDILLYDEQRIDSETLELPHPRMKERNFVLYPLAEIAGQQMLLPCGTILGTLLSECPHGDLTLTEMTFNIEQKQTGNSRLDAG